MDTIVSPVGPTRSFIAHEGTEPDPPIEKEGEALGENKTLESALQVVKSYRQARLLLLDAEVVYMASRLRCDALKATVDDCEEALESLVNHLIMAGDTSEAITVSKALLEASK